MLSAPEAIAKRRAIRKFDPNRPLADELLKQILGLASLAPSSFNTQPFRFLVVRSQKNRDRLRSCAYGQPKVGEAPVVIVVLGYHNPHKTNMPAIIDQSVRIGAMTKEIGAGILGRTSASLERVLNRDEWATRSTMPAAATLMIAAESLGVSSAPMEGFEPEKIRQEFGVPEDHAICALIALGFALEEPRVSRPFAVVGRLLRGAFRPTLDPRRTLKIAPGSTRFCNPPSLPSGDRSSFPPLATHVIMIHGHV